MSVRDDMFDGPWYAHPPMRNALVAGALSGVAFLLSHLGVVSERVEILLYGLSIPLGAYHWAREGLEELIHEGEFGIETLMLAASGGAAALGLFDEAAFLVVLYGGAEGLEEYTYARTRSSIRGLLDLAPKQASVVREATEVTIPAQEVRVGDVFVVRPGDAVPTDGRVVRGSSSVNESVVTGESMPVDKSLGSQVYAGSVNEHGVLYAEATSAFEDNTLSKIVHLVEDAQHQKSGTQSFIDRFGRRYSPAVLAGSVALLIAPLFLDLDMVEWANRAVVLLVAAAPCALVMSTPVAVAAGIGRAGRSGVLIKGGIHLENLGRTRVVAFDKTGTLTAGTPVVTDVIAIGIDERELLRIAAGVEVSSEHPLARAIVARARAAGIEPSRPDEFSAVVGAGARASIDGQEFFVGSMRHFEQRGVQIDQQGLERLRRDGKTIVVAGAEDKILGILAIRDEPRAEAQEAVAELHQLGLRTVMLTGDNSQTAEAIAKELGIDDVRAALGPDDKIAAIEQLERDHGAVLMVGDGINDAPALARATVGVAMGAAGSDAAIEAADTALMADDLLKIVDAIRLGRTSRAISTQNIIFSVALLAVLIPSALAGLISVAGAVVLHEGSELLAVANGLRAGRMP